MKSFAKKTLVSLPLVSMLFTSTSFAEKIQIGSSNPCGYKSIGNCVHDDRYTGGVYADNWMRVMTSKDVDGTPMTELKFRYRDKDAWELDMLPKALYKISHDQIDDVDFFNFTGHGFAVGGHNGITDNSSHYFTLNSHTNYHEAGEAGESANDANADSNELWFGYDANGVTSKTKWVSTYSCNFLNDSGPHWSSVMQGVHMVLGFGNVMFMMGDEGLYFGSKLINYGGSSVKDSWFDASRNYQIRSDDPVIVRVLYAGISKSDTIFNYSSKPQPISASNDYWYESITVQPNH